MTNGVIRPASLLSAVALLASSLSAFAQDSSPPTLTREQRQFRDFFNADRHHRGALDREEWLDYEWQTYSRYSSSGGDSLSLVDFQNMRCLTSQGREVPEPQRSLCKNAAARTFNLMTRLSGRLTKRDIASEANGYFRQNDHDHNGLVSWEELSAGAVR